MQKNREWLVLRQICIILRLWRYVHTVMRGMLLGITPLRSMHICMESMKKCLNAQRSARTGHLSIFTISQRASSTILENMQGAERTGYPDLGLYEN